MELKKKGFYFSMDAFLATMLLFIGLVLITNFSFKQIDTAQIDLMSKDVLTSFGALKVSELNDPWVQQQITEGWITNTDNTILEQIGAFWATGQIPRAQNLSKLLVEEIVPSRYGMSILMDDDIIYTKNKSSKPINLVSSRRLITGIEKGSPLEGSSAVALIRKVKSKKTSSYAYFGGFLGQGNVSVFLKDLPSDINSSNVIEMTLEGFFGGNFTMEIDGVQCQNTFYPQATGLEVDVWNVTSCASSLSEGNNTIEILFESALEHSYISGGYLRVTYVTDELQSPTTRTYKKYIFPGIDGVINLYDGFYVPGTLNEINIRLHYYSGSDTTAVIYMDVGNEIVFQANVTGDVDHTITDGTLSILLDYDLLSNKTIPLRLGFYAGNGSEVLGNITDAFLVLSRAATMGFADVEGTNLTRFDVAVNLSHEFVDIALNATGNRLGIGSFFAASQVNVDLTDDSDYIHSILNSWTRPQPSVEATRKMCMAVKLAKDDLAAVGPERNKIIVLMTDGNGTHPCDASNKVDDVRTQTIAQACDDYNISKVTFYTIGFGAGADDELLSAMANCTNGIYRQSNNITGLREIFHEFANIIAESAVSYEFQRVTSATNVESELYPDSYIEINFTPTIPPPAPEEITLMFQSEMFSSCNYDVLIPAGVNVKEAIITSYSQDFWTSTVQVDGTDVYNLSDFGPEFATMGDPFRIMIPAQLLTPGTHAIRMIIGANQSDDQGCSYNNSLIYRGAINLSSGRSAVVEFADGCVWTVETEGGEFTNFSIPSDYAGVDTCSYTSTLIDYGTNDAYDVAIYNLLSSLDLDGDGRIVFNIESEDMEIVISVLSGVPYLWGPSIIEVQVWQ
ncbi:MAG: vWA domain-containing protein [archaeon]